MAISFVNGYVCTSSCDVAKANANHGKDPHPASNAGTAEAQDGAERGRCSSEDH